MAIDETKLAKVLCDQFGLAPTHLELAQAWQKERGGALADILFEMRAVSEDVLEKAHSVLGRQTKNAGVIVGTSPGTERPDQEQPYDGRNRRRQARITNLLENFTVSVRAPTRMERASVKDISEGGLGLEVSGNPKVGEQIVVEVQSAGGTRVLCSGRVCHAKRGQKGTVVGVKFEDLSPVQKIAVAALFREAQRRDQELTDLHWLD